MWDLTQKASGQLRLAPDGHVLGLDLGVLMQMAQAMGYDTTALTELYPYIEAGIRDPIQEGDN